jgi:hypothetical protein
MIRHIVMFKLKDFGSSSENHKAAEQVRAELLSMKDRIAVIREFEVGINIASDPSAFEVVINSVFDSSDDLEAYRVHPDHQAFIAFNKNYTERKAVADYIF